MSEARFFFPKSRLAKLLARPGGMSVGTILQRSQASIESMRASAMNAIDAEIEDIAVLLAGRRVDRFQVVRQRAAELFGIAGAMGLRELSLAAESLYELVDPAGATPSLRAVSVHLDALRALRKPAVCDAPGAREAVLAALFQLTHQLAAQAQAAETAVSGARTLDRDIHELKSLVAAVQEADKDDAEPAHPETPIRRSAS